MRADLVTMTGASVSLRRASAGDEPFLQRLYADRRRPELAPLAWSDAAVTAFLTMQFRAQQQGYGTAYPDADHWIVSVGPAPVGRLLVDRGPVEHVIVDIVILARSRGRGIGTVLVSEVLADAAGAGVRVRLTAATADPRLPEWYRRLGFHIVEQNDIGARMVSSGL